MESVLTKFAGVSLTDRERMEGDKHAPHSQRTTAQSAEQQQQQQHNSAVQPDGGSSVLPRVKTESGVAVGGEAIDGFSATAAAYQSSSMIALDGQQQLAKSAGRRCWHVWHW